MKRRMCQSATARVKAPGLVRFYVLVCLALMGSVRLAAQTPDWRRLGGVTVEAGLASPASGPIDRVWFSADGNRLFARTLSGRVYTSADLETWKAATAEPPEDPAPAATPRLPTGALAARLIRGRLYARGRNLFRSDDGGRAWTNLTDSGGHSVVGGEIRDVAVSPTDENVLVAATGFGVWRSADGGLSWTGLHESLPNLPVRRILATARGATALRVWAPDIGPLELRPGLASGWHPVDDAAWLQEASLRGALSDSLGTEISAVGVSSELLHAGSVDGRIWTSRDRGRSWTEAPARWNGPVESIAVDPDEPRVAVAALGGRGAHVLRTVNGGLFWDDLSGNLPNVAAHGVTFDRAARALYAATDRGIFLSRIDLNAATPAEPWTAVAGLPEAPVWDVRLDPVRGQLYAAVDGFGVHATIAPHRASVLRWVNAADLSARPAAPGSLVSVLGAAVSRVQAGTMSVPLLASTKTEAQIQIPFEATGDALDLSLDSAGRQVSLGIPMQRVSPAIFIDPDGAPMLLDGETGLLLDAANSARSGTRVQILCTGLGRVTPDWPTGLAAPLADSPRVRANVAAFVDRTAVRVTRATLASGYIGFYLVEIELPALVNAGPAELYLTVDGQDSNRVRLYLAP